MAIHPQVTRNNLLANQNLRKVIDHGLDLDALRLPILPPGPYVSSSSGMSDDGVEILDEAPVNMRKKTVVIDLLETDSEGEDEGGPSRRATDNDEDGDEDDDDEEADEDVVVVPVKRGIKRKASSPTSSRRVRPDILPNLIRPRPINGHSAIPIRRHEEVGNAAGPSRHARAASPAMMIAFGDEPAQEVPLGWGGLGIPDRDPPAAGPSSVSAPAAANRQPASAEPAAAGSRSAPVRQPSTNNGAPPPPAVAAVPPVPAPPPALPLTAADHLPGVLEVIPNICTDWALKQLVAQVAKGNNENAANRVVEKAFEVEGGYPTAEQTAAAAASGSKEAKKEEPNYRSGAYKAAERRGDGYVDSVHALINEMFPMIPVKHLRITFDANFQQLVPTYFALVADQTADPKPYVPLQAGRNAKGKARSLLDAQFFEDIEGVADDNPFLQQRIRDGRQMYDKERKWLVNHLKQESEDEDARKAREIAHAEALANGGGMECGCCFGEELMENMFQCSEGHLFCRECTMMHIDTKLGEQKHTISCMDTSSCQALFPDSEITRVLPRKSLILYHRLKQASELDSANIEGLETCPNCPFSAIMDNPDEKLFRCLAPDCGTVTCRKCKKVEHLPKTCEEMEADRKLNSRHAVEDAMSDALIRRCPKCEKPFFKDEGCNKITCHLCRTISCYICRSIITDGYAHFDQNRADNAHPAATGKCNLWDSKGDQDAQAVVAARDAAQALARQGAAADGIQLADADLDVAAPAAYVRPGAAGYGRPMPPLQFHRMDALGVNPAYDRLRNGAQRALAEAALPALPNPINNDPMYIRDLAEQRRLLDGLYAAIPQANVGAMPPANLPPPQPHNAALDAYLLAMRNAAAENPLAGPAAEPDYMVRYRAQQAAEMERNRLMMEAAAAAAAAIVPGRARVVPLPMPNNPGPRHAKRRR